MSTRSRIADRRAGARLSVGADLAQRVAETFRALGDPTRVRIVAALADAERSVGDVARTVGLSQSAVSHQLALLRAQRIVASRRAGRRILYHLDDDHVRLLLQMGLEHASHAEHGEEVAP